MTPAKQLLSVLAMTAALMPSYSGEPQRKRGSTFCKTKAQTKKRIKAKAAKKARKKNR